MKIKITLALTSILFLFVGMMHSNAQSAKELLKDQNMQNEVMETIASNPDMMRHMMQHMMQNKQTMTMMMQRDTSIRHNMMRHMMQMAEEDSTMRNHMRNMMKDHPNMMKMMQDGHMMNDDIHKNRDMDHHRRKN